MFFTEKTDDQEIEKQNISLHIRRLPFHVRCPQKQR